MAVLVVMIKIVFTLLICTFKKCINNKLLLTTVNQSINFRNKKNARKNIRASFLIRKKIQFLKQLIYFARLFS